MKYSTNNINYCFVKSVNSFRKEHKNSCKYVSNMK